MVVVRSITLKSCVRLTIIVLLFWLLYTITKTMDFPPNNTDPGGGLTNDNRWSGVDKTHQSMRIPKIIHQIWQDEVLPSALVDNVRSLMDNHPGWDYYFWTDEAGQKLIEDKYPFLMDIYKADHLPKHAGLFRSDLLRYVVLHEYGGVYFDLDTVSVRPLDTFIQSTECSFVVEPAEHYFFFNVDIIISNAAMLCAPGHPFLKQILQHIMTIDMSCLSPMHCSGPLFITDIYTKLNKTGEIISKLPEILPSEVFMDVYDHPLQGPRLERTCRNMTSLKQPQRDICTNWIQRGKGDRTLSEKALTYHRWYHLKYHKNRFLPKDNITFMKPGVKIYGARNLDRYAK